MKADVVKGPVLETILWQQPLATCQHWTAGSPCGAPADYAVWAKSDKSDIFYVCAYHVRETRTHALRNRPDGRVERLEEPLLKHPGVVRRGRQKAKG